MCGTACAPSTMTGTSCSCAIRIISFMGLMVPSTFETCATETSFVLLENNFSYSSSNSSPLSFIGMTLMDMPFFAASICQGTMFEWCSMTDTIISSPGETHSSVKLEAIRLMDSVVPLVNMISLEERALRNC